MVQIRRRAEFSEEVTPKPYDDLEESSGEEISVFAGIFSKIEEKVSTSLKAHRQCALYVPYWTIPPFHIPPLV